MLLHCSRNVAQIYTSMYIYLNGGFPLVYHSKIRHIFHFEFTCLHHVLVHIFCWHRSKFNFLSHLNLQSISSVQGHGKICVPGNSVCYSSSGLYSSINRICCHCGAFFLCNIFNLTFYINICMCLLILHFVSSFILFIFSKILLVSL